MKNILVIGATGQIGTELTKYLRSLYGDAHVVAGHVASVTPSDDLKAGPTAVIDVLQPEAIDAVVRQYSVDTIYNLAALLSVVAEGRPRLAWQVGIEGLWNVLEVAREHKCAVFTPSSIGSFGPNTPHDNTPQDTIQRPLTIYGVSKVTTELLSDYFHHRYGLDTRSVRFPGIISHVTEPGGGTTDYAVDIYYSAVRGETFHCPLEAGTFLDMMYMPDALHAAVSLMEADPARLVHRNGFNVTAMSFDPEMLRQAIVREVPTFQMDYQPDPLKQQIANSWPNSLDDSCARNEWDWKPRYDLAAMTHDMLVELRKKLG